VVIYTEVNQPGFLRYVFHGTSVHGQHIHHIDRQYLSSCYHQSYSRPSMNMHMCQTVNDVRIERERD
jgi:hypothetical protein